MELIAIKKIGRTLPGARLNVPRAQGRVLVILGLAKKPEPIEEPKPVVVEPPKIEEPPVVRPKRTYTRRNYATSPVAAVMTPEVEAPEEKSQD